MSSLPAECRAALNDIGHLVDQEIARSKRSNGIETLRFREACFITWCKEHKVPDPCSVGVIAQRLAAYFLKDLIRHNNCRSATMRGYGESINALHAARNFPPPVDFEDDSNMCKILYKNLKAQEDIANKRSPLTAKIIAELQKMVLASPCADSPENAANDWVCFNKSAGCRSCEYLQKLQSKVEVHEYPSGLRVTKAFTRDDFVFFDADGRVITTHCEANLQIVASVRVRWRIQKNRENGQTITFAENSACHDMCEVRAAYRIFLRSIKLGQRSDEPMGIFVNKHGKTKYFTASKLTEILRAAAARAHPDWTQEELNRISTHSSRVYALVLLSEAGMKDYIIKARLRWLGDSYKGYLRDTAALAHMQSNALRKLTDQVRALIGHNFEVEISNVDPISEAEMGEYTEFD